MKSMLCSQTLSQHLTTLFGKDGLVCEFFRCVNNIDKELVDTRAKAIEVALAVTSGAYQASLLSFFTHRDLFPSLMKVGILFYSVETAYRIDIIKYIQDSDTNSRAFEPFT